LLTAKQFRETTNMASAIVLDHQRIDGFRRRGRHRTSLRRDFGRGARASHLGTRRRVSACSPANASSPRAGRQHLRGLLASLSSLTAAGDWRAADSVRRASERLKRRGLLLVLSDFYDDEERTLVELRRAARMGHEVVLFQILSRDEIELPYRRDLEFADLESDRTLAINAGLARRQYTDAMAAFLERWHSRAGAEGFQYSLIVTDTPPERALRNFLLARRK
jgi:hypothetical protein